MRLIMKNKSLILGVFPLLVNSLLAYQGVVLLACVFAIAYPSVLAAVPECPEWDPVYGAYFPDPDDCRYFYHCSNGEAIHVMCAPGTVFNATLNVCDHANDLSCIPAK